MYFDQQPPKIFLSRLFLLGFPHILSGPMLCLTMLLPVTEPAPPRLFQHVNPSTFSHIKSLNSWAGLVKWREGSNRWHESLSSSCFHGRQVSMAPKCQSESRSMERPPATLGPMSDQNAVWMFSWPRDSRIHCCGDPAAAVCVRHGPARPHFSYFTSQVYKSVGLVRVERISFICWWFEKPLCWPKENRHFAFKKTEQELWV